MKTLCMIILATAILTISAADQRFKLRPEGAGAIAKKSAPLPTADRVEIYVTGPKWEVDRSSTIVELRKRMPEYVLAAKGDAAQLMARLRSKGDKAENRKLKVRDGYTYHLLVFQEREGTMTHIRVLDTGDGKQGTSAEVYPDTTTSFSFLNDEIGPWLQANVKIQHLGRK